MQMPRPTVLITQDEPRNTRFQHPAILTHWQWRPSNHHTAQSTAVDPLFHIVYPPKCLATKNHSQGTKVRGESGQSPVEVVGGTEMPSLTCRLSHL